MLVNISEIKVKKRVRKDLGDINSLKDSLKRYGLLNPITIDSKNRLIAGERRLEAAKARKGRGAGGHGHKGRDQHR